MLLNNNADACAERKQKERERKHYAKIKKNYTAVTTNSSSQELLQPVSTSFSNPAIKSRNIERVEKSLRKSQRKKKEVIKSLASKFNISIKLGQQ